MRAFVDTEGTVPAKLGEPVALVLPDHVIAKDGSRFDIRPSPLQTMVQEIAHVAKHGRLPDGWAVGGEVQDWAARLLKTLE